MQQTEPSKIKVVLSPRALTPKKYKQVLLKIFQIWKIFRQSRFRIENLAMLTKLWIDSAVL